MGLFSKFRRSKESAASGASDGGASAHLEEFLATRRGVEAFIELPTTMTKSTLLLIAYDGEWTRRSVPSVQWARGFAASHGIPAYDAGVVGYPQRMRDYNARHRAPKPTPRWE